MWSLGGSQQPFSCVWAIFGMVRKKQTNKQLTRWSKSKPALDQWEDSLLQFWPQNHSTISILLVCRSVHSWCYFPSPIDFPPGPSTDWICCPSKCFPAFPSPRRKALYWPYCTTKYQAVPTYTDPVPQSTSFVMYWPSTIRYQPTSITLQFII